MLLSTVQNVLTLLYFKFFWKDFLWDGVYFEGSGSGHRFSLQIKASPLASRSPLETSLVARTMTDGWIWRLSSFYLWLNYYRSFPHDVTAAILMFQSNETEAMLVSQTSPVEVELFSYVKPFFCRFCWLREWKRSILVSVLSRPNPLAMLNLRITVSHLFAQKEALAFIPVFEKSFKFLESGRKRRSIELFFQLFLHLRKTKCRSSIKLNSGKREKVH